jgi:hypothetical protein
VSFILAVCLFGLISDLVIPLLDTKFTMSPDMVNLFSSYLSDTKKNGAALGLADMLAFVSP